MATIHLKRAYEEPSRSDGLRILVERLWPRRPDQGARGGRRMAEGDRAQSALRRWFGHDPAKWEEFQKRYWAELDANQEAVAEPTARKTREGPVTLVYAAQDEQHNGALVLWEYLRRHPS